MTQEQRERICKVICGAIADPDEKVEMAARVDAMSDTEVAAHIMRVRPDVAQKIEALGYDENGERVPVSVEDQIAVFEKEY